MTGPYYKKSQGSLRRLSLFKILLVIILTLSYKPNTIISFSCYEENNELSKFLSYEGLTTTPEGRR